MEKLPAMQHQLYVASSYPCYPTSSQSLYPAYPSSRSLDYGMSTSAAAAMYPMPVKKNDEFEAFSLQVCYAYMPLIKVSLPIESPFIMPS